MLHPDGSWFKDDAGRTLLLRGVNLGGDTKVPTVPDGATHHPEGFFDHRMVSFVGRPFPLSEASEHLSRLKSWGLTMLRLLVTWEAIEHAGPGLYDTEYLDYVEQVVHLAGEMGFMVFIDPHQDVWSRFSGGDGAPGWTLEVSGFDMTQFADTCAAIVHQTHGDPFSSVIWPTNVGRLASATMFTLFFGGNVFAPHVLIDGEPVQDYLQQHYIDSVVQVVQRLKGMPCVVGYDTLNEPSHGYIGWKDLTAHEGLMKTDLMPTPLESFALGDGLEQEVGIWGTGLTGSHLQGHRRLNIGHARAWKEGRSCIWRDHGVWNADSNGRPHVLVPDYFSRVDGRDVEFERDYLVPFIRRYVDAVRLEDPKALFFAEGEPQSLPPRVGEGCSGFVSAPHWYDAIPLLLKRSSDWVGYDAVRKRTVVGPSAVHHSAGRQLAAIRRAGVERLNGPTVFGEIGVPYDLHGGRAFRTGDYREQEALIDRSLCAVESSLCSATIWNYTATNTNERGDGWNGEDLSIWSADQGRDARVLDRGGRALRAVVRPYPVATAGEPLRLSFDMRRRVLRFVFRHDPCVIEPTEIFVPPLQYPFGYKVWMTDGTFLKDDVRHVLTYRHTLGQPTHTIIIRPKQAPTKRHVS
ncbi:MAG: cellulase family glycosylhydrolase [Candidatus Cryosericum sp.]